MAPRTGRKHLQNQAIQQAKTELNKRPAGRDVLQHTVNKKAHPAASPAALKIDAPKRPEPKPGVDWQKTYKAGQFKAKYPYPRSNPGSKALSRSSTPARG